MHNYIKKIWIVLFLLIFTQKGFSAAEATPAATAGSGEALKSIFSFIEYAEGTTVTFKTKIETYLQNLRDTYTGARLLGRLQGIMGSQVLIIRQIESGGVCFNPGKGRLALDINLFQLENSRVPCVGSLAENIVTSGKVSVSVFPIGSCKNPPSAVLGHELIHALHYLEDTTTEKTLYSKTYDSTLWLEISHVDKRFTLKTELVDQYLWGGKFEELLTIVGLPGAGEFTENAIRKDLGLPPRYAYQNAELHFYEDADIIRILLSTSLGTGWRAHLEESHLTMTDYNMYRFNREEALECQYTPYEFVSAEAAAGGGGGGGGAGAGFRSLAPSGASSESLAEVFAARRNSRSSQDFRGGGGGGGAAGDGRPRPGLPRSISVGRGGGGLGKSILTARTAAGARRHSATDEGGGGGGTDDDAAGEGGYTVARAGRPPRGGGGGAARAITLSTGLAVSVAAPAPPPAPASATGDGRGGAAGTTEGADAGKKTDED